MSKKLILPLTVLLLAASPAMAYVGPGSGLGAIGVALGFIATIFLTILSFIWYPIKRAWRGLRRAKARSRATGQPIGSEVPVRVRRR